MNNLIMALGDEKAEAVLAAMTQPIARHGHFETDWTPDLGRALGSAFGIEPGSASPPSEGDLARQALLLLAQDPTRREALQLLIENDIPRSFSVGIDAAVIAGVLILLQTHVKFEKHKDGKTSWKIEKKATSDQLLKPLVEKLLGWFSGRHE